MLSYTGQWCLVVSLMTLSLTASMPTSISSSTTPSSTFSSTATSRAMSPSPISETMKQLAMQLNATSHITFDTRTPPKFREQTRRDHTAEIIEFAGHPGVAMPVDDEGLLMEEEHKKMNFYKVDKPTTDSGLSTWILLSGQSTTNKPMKKPLMQKTTIGASTESNENKDKDKVIKPIFKRKTTTPISTISTTTAPQKKTTPLVSTTLKSSISTDVTTEKPEKTTKLTKVKASLSSGNKTTLSPKKVTPITTVKPTKTTTKLETSSPVTATTSTTVSTKSEFVKVPTKSPTSASGSNDLNPEAKEGTLDLSSTTTDKKAKVRPTTTTPKKKKIKTRRKKPSAEDKMDSTNSTKLSNKNKERPIGTQLYNYLSREVMPTVGVGLVGLVVTAGLASYFLYPFGPIRRSYQVDRKDKEGNYHYTDQYSGGIAEEEAIGKVIAGMPASNYYNTRSHNSRNTYGLNYNDHNTGNGVHVNVGYQPSQHSRFRNVDQRYMEGTVETVALNPMATYNSEEVIIGSPKKTTFTNHKDTYETYEVGKPGFGKESLSILGENNREDQFVVGNVPQDIQMTTETQTPAVVPEHGPRTIEGDSELEMPQQEKVFVVQSVPAHADALFAMDHLPRRRKRQVRKLDKSEKDIDNEIDLDDKAILKATSAPRPSFTSAAFSKSVETSTVNLLNSDSTKETLYDTTTFDEMDKLETTTTHPIIEKTESILGLIKDLIYLKMRLGLQVLHDKAESLTRYFRNVQERIDVSYKNAKVNQTIKYSSVSSK